MHCIIINGPNELTPIVFVYDNIAIGIVLMQQIFESLVIMADSKLSECLKLLRFRNILTSNICYMYRTINLMFIIFMCRVSPNLMNLIEVEVSTSIYDVSSLQSMIAQVVYEPKAECRQSSWMKCHFLIFSDFEQLHRADFFYSEAKILTH